MVVMKRCTEPYTAENLCTSSFFVREGGEIPGETLRISEVHRVRGRVAVLLSNGEYLEKHIPTAENLVEATPEVIRESLIESFKHKDESLEDTNKSVGEAAPKEPLKPTEESPTISCVADLDGGPCSEESENIQKSIEEEN